MVDCLPANPLYVLSEMQSETLELENACVDMREQYEL